MSDHTVDKPKQAKWIESPDGILEVYANQTHITWTVDDIRVRLAQLVPSAETRSPGMDFVGVAEERAAFTLSWRMAKLLRDQLASAIDNFEKTNGTIKTDLKLPMSTP